MAKFEAVSLLTVANQTLFDLRLEDPKADSQHGDSGDDTQSVDSEDDTQLEEMMGDLTADMRTMEGGAITPRLIMS